MNTILLSKLVRETIEDDLSSVVNWILANHWDNQDLIPPNVYKTVQDIAVKNWDTIDHENKKYLCIDPTSNTIVLSSDKYPTTTKFFVAAVRSDVDAE